MSQWVLSLIFLQFPDCHYENQVVQFLIPSNWRQSLGHYSDHQLVGDGIHPCALVSNGLSGIYLSCNGQEENASILSIIFSKIPVDNGYLKLEA